MPIVKKIGVTKSKSTVKNTWNRQLKTLDNIQDKDIDYSDSPDMGDANWAEFKAFNPTKKMISFSVAPYLICNLDV